MLSKPNHLLVYWAMRSQRNSPRIINYFISWVPWGCQSRLCLQQDPFSPCLQVPSDKSNHLGSATSVTVWWKHYSFQRKQKESESLSAPKFPNQQAGAHYPPNKGKRQAGVNQLFKDRKNRSNFLRQLKHLKAYSICLFFKRSLPSAWYFGWR